MKKMILLDHKGQPQMDMIGGERIFSRVSTKKIIDLASKANDEKGLLELGKAIYNEIKAQNKRQNK